MINSVSSDNIKTSIFYINDFHGKSVNMERATLASYEFDTRYGNKKNVDTFKLSSGDIAIGEDIPTNKTSVLFQKILNISSSTLGNHEYDVQDKIKDILPKINYNLLASNIKISPRSSVLTHVRASVTEERNGHKYGIIGVTPIDLYKRTKHGVIHQNISVDDALTTLKDIQLEADKLKQQGVNKIILLSHLGNSLDRIVAQNTSGVDVILGGHSHELIFDVKEGENLFYNADGEPVIITQAGRDGNNFGILNLEFDNKGIIKKVQNNIGYTKDFGRYLPVKYVFDKMFGNNIVCGVINSAPKSPDNFLIGKNPHAYFIADCMKNILDGDIALIQSANIRGHFEKGDLDSRTISNILPFRNKLWKMRYSEKDIVEAIKYSATSYLNEANKPGIFYASGLKYSISNMGQLLSMSFINKAGKEQPIDVNNPRADKYYTTIINDYCAQGNDRFAMLNRPNQIIEKYDIDSGDCVKQYMSKVKSANIKDDGRLDIVNS